MSKYISTIATLVITFIVTLILNSISSYFGGGSGSVSISHPLQEKNGNIVIVSINNYSSKFIDGVILEVPHEVSSKNFYSDTAVQITDSTSGIGQDNGSVKISQISPRRITTIVISDVKEGTGNSVRAVNAPESGLTLLADDDLETPLHRAIDMALFASIMQAVIVAIGAYYVERRMDQIKESLKEIKEKSEEISKQRESLLKEVRDTKGYAAKLRILLLGKISDYSKELDFWRNLIKEITYSGGIRKGDHDKLLHLVKKTLKTYGATDSLPELEEIKIAASWLRDEERRLGHD